ncbi:o-succinylbenzoate--CoA ligase [Lapidilactobacillus concavus DSM 17758]|uniref:O-succinylbenzoate--CoA ligase n=1 Tax=Lapidilactobacillus concavus DSM 17758 TaxID=1423735 RepID=A0A0R1W1F7_9LACO|nr:o-succinylbenzoate--CoA ligase [Lapidilactobacillus concavus DSM 17758]GEL13838.1 hypothetical protein LCO01nite_13870 [Lapidilactobacillus concavus]
MTKLTTALSEKLVEDWELPLIKSVESDNWVTRHEFHRDVTQLLTLLQATKIGYQDQVLICLDNSVAYPELMQAFWRLGAAVHPVSATTPLDQLIVEWQAQNYVAIITTHSLAESIATMLPLRTVDLNLISAAGLSLVVDTHQTAARSSSPTGTIREQDLVLILNTSGTTGKPKRVGLTHELLYNAAVADMESQAMTATDTTLITMPMFHINAQVMSVLAMRLAGGRIVVAPKFSASHFWQQVADNQVTWSSVVPTIITILLLNQEANRQYLQH